jgi:endogenous inhibitor of DNA gyrase (YacG/DUF329 family)
MTARCPICGKSFEVGRLEDTPSFPFCSERCRLVDLGRWLDGAYVVPGEGAPAPAAGELSEPPPEDHDET